MNNSTEIRLTAAEFSAFMPAGGTADRLFELTLGAQLGQARGLKAVGALWLSIRLDAMGDVEREGYSQALERSVRGLRTPSCFISWVPMNSDERRMFAFFSEDSATIVALRDDGFLDVIGLDASAAIDYMVRVVAQSAASRFVVTAKDIAGADVGIAWQDEVLAVRERGVWAEVPEVPRVLAAKRIARDLASVIRGLKVSDFGATRSESRYGG
jgi:hypothetical protein